MMDNANFEYDVFISYTHLDNKPLSKDEEGWISRFHYSFNIRLAQLLGREAKIWWDKEIQGNDEFSDKIIAKLQKTKVLLTVISPGYLNSKWCKKELDLFIEAAEKSNIGIRIGNKYRISKVIKTYVPRDRHPSEIQGTTGHEFCELDEKKNIIEFNQEYGPEYQIKFYKRLNQVAGDICKLIEEMGQPAAARGQQPKNPPEKTVYLAETTSDLREEWENIRGELEQRDYTVFPDPSHTYQDESFKDTVRNYLKQCRLSIHLIGNRYGSIPEDEKQSIIELQNELAVEQCEKGKFTRLIWIPKGLDEHTVENRQKKYIDDLQEYAPRVPGTELFYTKTGLEDFKTIIKDILKELNEPPEEEVDKDQVEKRARVYLVYDQKDEESAEPLNKCLFDKKLEVMTPSFDGDVTQIRTLHRKYLRRCDAMVIYYDHANDTWLKTKLLDLEKALGQGRIKPIPKWALTVFISGEKTRHKERFHSHDFSVIKNYSPFSCDLLSSFISNLKEGKGNGGDQ
jgi:hypothetical protein